MERCRNNNFKTAAEWAAICKKAKIQFGENVLRAYKRAVNLPQSPIKLKNRTITQREVAAHKECTAAFSDNYSDWKLEGGDPENGKPRDISTEEMDTWMDYENAVSNANDARRHNSSVRGQEPPIPNFASAVGAALRAPTAAAVAKQAPVRRAPAAAANAKPAPVRKDCTRHGAIVNRLMKPVDPTDFLKGINLHDVCDELGHSKLMLVANLLTGCPDDASSEPVLYPIPFKDKPWKQSDVDSGRKDMITSIFCGKFHPQKHATIFHFHCKVSISWLVDC